MGKEMEKIHDLKVWPDFFPSLLDGSKRFELREDDRGFQVGDYLRLREYAPGPDEYTGQEITALVTYKIDANTIPFGAAALKPGFCILGITFNFRRKEKPHA